jgi:hypothetical protein
MQSILRLGIGVLLGAALMAAALLAQGAQAQTTPVVSGAASVGPLADGAPHFINYQGQLFAPATGRPLSNQSFSAAFTLYGDANGGSVLWVENKVINTNVDGIFNTQLGDASGGVNFALFDGRALYLGVRINGEEARPLQPLTYVPYAVWARNADKLGGLGEGDFARVLAFGFVNGDCSRRDGRDFSSRRQFVDPDNVCVIDIANADYDTSRHQAVITPACNRAVMVGTGRKDDLLIVDIWDHNGTRTDCAFQFTLFARR